MRKSKNETKIFPKQQKIHKNYLYYYFYTMKNLLRKIRYPEKIWGKLWEYYIIFVFVRASSLILISFNDKILIVFLKLLFSINSQSLIKILSPGTQCDNQNKVHSKFNSWKFGFFYAATQNPLSHVWRWKEINAFFPIWNISNGDHNQPLSESLFADTFW